MELWSYPLCYDLRHLAIRSILSLMKDPNTSLLYKKILTLNYKIPNDISSFAKDILKGLITSNTKRSGLLEIRNH